MEVFSVEETAKILKVSQDTIRRMIKSGELEAFKVHRQYRIRKDVLERFMQGGLPYQLQQSHNEPKHCHQ